MHACHQDNDIFTDSIKRRIVLYSFLLSWSDADIHGRYAVTSWDVQKSDDGPVERDATANVRYIAFPGALECAVK